MAVYLYESTAADFTANGLGAVMMQSGTVTEKAGGAYEVELICPVDEGQKWMRLQTGRILKAPVPERTTPAATDSFSRWLEFPAPDKRAGPERTIFPSK